jgi:hypothetical protein
VGKVGQELTRRKGSPKKRERGGPRKARVADAGSPRRSGSPGGGSPGHRKPGTPTSSPLPPPPPNPHSPKLRGAPAAGGWAPGRLLQVAPCGGRRRQDDGRASERASDRPTARERRGTRSGGGGARARAGALTPGGRSCAPHSGVAPLGLAAPSHTEIARFTARLPRLLGRFRLSHFRVEARLTEWRRRRPMRSGWGGPNPLLTEGVASLATDSFCGPMSARAGWPSGSRRELGRD